MDIRSQFPILNQQVHGKRLVYLDSAATALKPISVVEAERAYELEYCANIHRGVHYLSEKATLAYEQVRTQAQKFLNARSEREIIFTPGTTAGINLVAYSYGRKFLKSGDEIWISSLEHHSNIVPWQILCQEIGCVLKVIPLGHSGELEFCKNSKLLAFTYASNALGIFNPVEDWIKQAKAHNMTVLIDAAQAAPHIKLDVQALDCDFLVFSGHKIYGPTGTGILYGKEALLNSMPPYQTGGDMIEQVTFEKTTYAKLPAKFEAGTPNISGVIGLGAAIDFLGGLPAIASAKAGEVSSAKQRLLEVPGIRLFGDTENKLPIFSFLLGNIHPHDISSIIDQEGVAVRAGHLCTQPLLKLLGVPALVRASLGAYNTSEDIDALVSALFKVKQVFRC
ncbi:MAG: SufS family cysteine desulfurase [Myxococcaceae bacterium]